MQHPKARAVSANGGYSPEPSEEPAPGLRPPAPQPGQGSEADAVLPALPPRRRLASGSLSRAVNLARQKHGRAGASQTQLRREGRELQAGVGAAGVDAKPWTSPTARQPLPRSSKLRHEQEPAASFSPTRGS